MEDSGALDQQNHDGRGRCAACRHQWDEELHLPLALPCGHSVCDGCARGQPAGCLACPQCGWRVPGGASGLKKNFDVIAVVRALAAASPRHLRPLLLLARRPQQ